MRCACSHTDSDLVEVGRNETETDILASQWQPSSSQLPPSILNSGLDPCSCLSVLILTYVLSTTSLRRYIIRITTRCQGKAKKLYPLLPQIQTALNKTIVTHPRHDRRWIIRGTVPHRRPCVRRRNHGFIYLDTRFKKKISTNPGGTGGDIVAWLAPP